jgi:hypothetical protein
MWMLLLLPWLLVGGLAAQDLVCLHDGRTFEGKVLQQDDDGVTIETSIAGIRSTLTFPAEDVVSVELGVAPPPEEPDPVLPDPTEDPVDPPVAGEGYLAVPLTGTFGEEITAEGLGPLLRRARLQEGLRHIVFLVDSPGGDLLTARAMAEVMDEHDDCFDYHAIVTRGLSASIWIVLRCDTIHMRPGAVLGAAVPFRFLPSGAVEVSEKLISACVAELRAAAEAKGHPGKLVAPMVRMQATISVWLSSEGGVHYTLNPPRYLEPDRLILEDGPTTVLTLTSEQARATGLAEVADVDADTLGSALGLEEWTSAGDYAVSVMERGAEAHAEHMAELEGIALRIAELAEEITDRLDRARESFVSRLDMKTLVYTAATGRLDDHSQTRWRNACTGALTQVRKARKRMAQIRRMVEQLEKAGVIDLIDEGLLSEVERRLDSYCAKLEAMLRYTNIRQITAHARTGW